MGDLYGIVSTGQPAAMIFREWSTREQQGFFQNPKLETRSSPALSNRTSDNFAFGAQAESWRSLEHWNESRVSARGRVARRYKVFGITCRFCFMRYIGARGWAACRNCARGPALRRIRHRWESGRQYPRRQYW